MAARSISLGRFRSITRGLFGRPKFRHQQSAIARAVIEALEQRILLSTWNVTTTGGNDGLVHQLYLAQQDSGSQIIDIAASLGGATMAMGTTLSIDHSSGTITIQNLGTGLVTITGGNGYRDFDIQSSVTLEGLNIINGNAGSYNGGGILNSGNLTISNCVIGDNKSYYGGGISSTGNLTISNSIISGNEASEGGGIYNSGSLSMSGSTLSANSAIGGSGGGGIYDPARNQDQITISNSLISGNTTSAIGGGIEVGNYFSSKSNILSIVDSTISDNSASVNGGGISACYAGVSISNSTISGNSGNKGAGILAYYGTSLSCINSTITGNTAALLGGAIYSDMTSPSYISVTDCTLSGNSAGNAHGGGGIYGSATLNGSIVAQSNSGGDLSSFGTFVGSDNLIGDNSGNLTGTSNHRGEPDLSAPGYYGGPTETIVPLPVSGNPALDDGYADISSPILYDQRGLPRPTSETQINIGAVQLDDNPSQLQVNTNLDDPF
jgi:hypothetical protein